VLVSTLYLHETSSLEPECCNLSRGSVLSFEAPPSPLVPRVPTGTAPPYSFAFHLSEACWDLLLTPSAPTVWSADKSPVVQPPFPPCTASSAISLSFSLHRFLYPVIVVPPQRQKQYVPREVLGGWRQLHSEELRDLYSSPSILRMIK
jgi:hypothetical protein